MGIFKTRKVVRNMNKTEAIKLAKKAIKKYEERGMVADAMLWQSILDALMEE